MGVECCIKAFQISYRVLFFGILYLCLFFRFVSHLYCTVCLLWDDLYCTVCLLRDDWLYFWRVMHLLFQVYLEEKSQEVDSLTSKIKELEAQLYKEKEDCKRY